MFPYVVRDSTCETIQDCTHEDEKPGSTRLFRKDAPVGAQLAPISENEQSRWNQVRLFFSQRASIEDDIPSNKFSDSDSSITVLHSMIVSSVSFGRMGFSYEHFRGRFRLVLSFLFFFFFFSSPSPGGFVWTSGERRYIDDCTYVHLVTKGRNSASFPSTGKTGLDITYFVIRAERATKNASGWRGCMAVGWDYNNSRRCVQFQSACPGEPGASAGSRTRCFVKRARCSASFCRILCSFPVPYLSPSFFHVITWNIVQYRAPTRDQLKRESSALGYGLSLFYF